MLSDTPAVQSTDLMEMAVEASPNGMIMINGNGKIMLVNSSVEKLFGYTREELIGNDIELLVPEKFRSIHPKDRQTYSLNPTSRAMGENRELYAVHKDGHEFPVEIGLNPIKKESEILVLAAVVDITERKRAQEMMQLAVEAAPNGMIMTDADGMITMVNSSAESLFGYAREELVGSSIGVLVPDRFRATHPHLREAYFQQPVSRAMGKGRDLYARRKSGEEIAVEIGLNPIKTLKGAMILASVVDITERKRQEKSLKDALNEKEVLLSEIHHRVKNNLQIIDSLIGMQLDSVVSDRAIEVLTDSQNRVKSMAMIHQVLYQSGNLSGVEISTVLHQLVSSLATSYAANNIKVIVDVDELFLPLDLSIPLGLIVNELVSNSFKHAFKNRDSGKIRIECKRSSTDYILLSVTDDGVGFDTEYQKVIDGTAMESLGLRLVQVLSEQIGGKLSVKTSGLTQFSLLFSG